MKRSDRLVPLLCAVLALSGCADSVLAPIGPVGDADRTILLDSVAIMLAIVVPVIVATLAFAWWFRAGNERARRLPRWSYSGRLELIIWSIPALVVLFLGGIAWIGSHDLDPARPLASHTRPLQLQVVALDWKWQFNYPDEHIAILNRLVLPAGVPLRLRITSATVFNVFFVPQLGSMIYAMAGMRSELHLQADRPGTYLGESANFSGDGFPTMHFPVEVLTAGQFRAWAAGTRGHGPALTELSYRALLRQSSAVAPYSYGDVQPGLFDRIVSLQLPPGSGPPVTSAAAAIRPP